MAAERRQVQQESSGGSPGGSRPRVLVVEDKPNVLQLLATILEKGYEVTTAADGATALSLIGSVPLDVVLTAVRMPGASGFDVLRSVRRRAPRTSVVLMTAYANVPDAVAAMKLGAYDYVAKPLDADEISLLVARAVDHSRQAERTGDEAGPGEDERCGGGEGIEEVSVGFRRAVEEARDRASRAYLVKLMEHFRGNVTQAAKRAAMTRESLHRVLKKYAVQADSHREETDEGGQVA